MNTGTELRISWQKSKSLRSGGFKKQECEGELQRFRDYKVDDIIKGFLSNSKLKAGIYGYSPGRFSPLEAKVEIDISVFVGF